MPGRDYTRTVGGMTLFLLTRPISATEQSRYILWQAMNLKRVLPTVWFGKTSNRSVPGPVACVDSVLFIQMLSQTQSLIPVKRHASEGNVQKSVARQL